jgi:hypothetical protein
LKSEGKEEKQMNTKKLSKTQLENIVGQMSSALVVQASDANDSRQKLQRAMSEVTRCKAVAASAYQVLNLALIEPKDSAMTKHLVHVCAVALGTIEE